MSDGHQGERSAQGYAQNVPLLTFCVVIVSDLEINKPYSWGAQDMDLEENNRYTQCNATQRNNKNKAEIPGSTVFITFLIV